MTDLKTEPTDETELRSALPIKRPKRIWEPTRRCGCGMGRYFPPSSLCPQPENAVQLFVSRPA